MKIYKLTKEGSLGIAPIRSISLLSTFGVLCVMSRLTSCTLKYDFTSRKGASSLSPFLLRLFIFFKIVLLPLKQKYHLQPNSQ